jgi:hypothetical protein
MHIEEITKPLEGSTEKDWARYYSFLENESGISLPMEDEFIDTWPVDGWLNSFIEKNLAENNKHVYYKKLFIGLVRQVFFSKNKVFLWFGNDVFIDGRAAQLFKKVDFTDRKYQKLVAILDKQSISGSVLDLMNVYDVDLEKVKHFSKSTRDYFGFLLHRLDFFGKFMHWEDVQVSSILYEKSKNFSSWDEISGLVEFSKVNSFCNGSMSFIPLGKKISINFTNIINNLTSIDDIFNMDKNKLLSNSFKLQGDIKIYHFPNISTGRNFKIVESNDDNSLRVFHYNERYGAFFPNLGKRFPNYDVFLTEYNRVADKLDKWYSQRNNITITKVIPPVLKMSLPGKPSTQLDEHGCTELEIYSSKAPRGCHEKDSTIGYRERLRNCSQSIGEFMERETKYKDEIFKLKSEIKTLKTVISDNSHNLAQVKKPRVSPTVKQPRASPAVKQPRASPTVKKPRASPAVKKPRASPTGKLKKVSGCKDKESDDCGKNNDGCAISKTTGKCYKVPVRRKKTNEF